MERCCENLAKCKFDGNVEFVLVDDGSSDNTLLLCQAVAEKDARFRVFTQKNAGPFAARKKGVAEARGEFITFVDYDDLFSEDYISHLYALAKKHDADCVRACYETVFSYDYTFPKTNFSVKVLEGNDDVLRFYLNEFIIGRKNFGGHWCWLYKKDVFSNFEYFECEGNVGEDLLTNFFLLQYCKKMVFSEKVVYGYFQSNNSSIMQTFSYEKCKFLINNLKNFKKVNLSQNAEILNLLEAKAKEATFITGIRAVLYPDIFTAEQKRDLLATYRPNAFHVIFKGRHSLKVRVCAFLVLVCPRTFTFVVKILKKSSLFSRLKKAK